MVSPIPAGAFHVSRQKLARTLDFQEVARNTDAMDRALAEATSNTEGFLKRGFFPFKGTRVYDWPSVNNPVSYRIRLNDNELISLSGITAGTATLNPAHTVLYPTFGPPYNVVETSLGYSDVFQAGTSWQGAVSLTGTWCGCKLDTRNVGTLSGSINSSVTSLTLSDSSVVGVGDVLLLDSEYMVVRGQNQTSTSQTLQTPLTASAANTSVAVTTGSAYAVGEMLTLDSEQMLIVDITSNTLLVRRAFNGTVLAAHTGSTIYAPRAYVIDRAACGSTAAAHTSAITVYQHVIPPTVESLSLAEAAWVYTANASGWQTAGKGTDHNVGSLGMLQDLRHAARSAYGRQARQRAV